MHAVGNEHECEAMTTEALSEAAKLQRVPGIYFMDGPAGRRACISGTGLAVFEIIRTLKAFGNRHEVAETYDWLAPAQLRAAFAYYELFPDDVKRFLRLERELTPDWVLASEQANGHA